MNRQPAEVARPFAAEMSLGVLVGERSWEAHPDGNGYRPIDPARRGNINLPCPHCDAPLVRDASEEIIRPTVFGCGVCHKPSGGRDAQVSSPEPPKVG